MFSIPDDMALTPEQLIKLSTLKKRYESELAIKDAELSQKLKILENCILTSQYRLPVLDGLRLDIEEIGKEALWDDGTYRPDLFLAQIESIIWKLRTCHDWEITTGEHYSEACNRKKVKREISALAKAINGLSNSSLRVLLYTTINHDDLKRIDFTLLGKLVNNADYHIEFPTSSALRKAWIKETFDVFNLQISTSPTGNFGFVLEAIQETCGFDYGEYGTANAMKDILPTLNSEKS